MGPVISPSTGSYTHQSVVCQSVIFGVGGGLGEGGTSEAGVADGDDPDGLRPVMPVDHGVTTSTVSAARSKLSATSP